MSREFDGVDDRINCGTSTLVNNMSNMTIALWITPSTVGSLGMRLVDKDSGSNGWHISNGGGNDQDGALSFRMNFEGGLMNVITANSPNYTANEVFHIAVVWNGGSSKDSIAWYKNGRFLPNDSGGSAGAGVRRSDTAANLIFGASQVGSAFYDGNMSHVHIFNRILSQGEVGQIMRVPGSITRGLVTYHRLEGYGNFEPNYYGTVNHGSVIGAIKGVGNKQAIISSVYRMPEPSLWYASAIAATTDATTAFYSKMSVDAGSKLSILSQTKLTLVVG